MVNDSVKLIQFIHSSNLTQIIRFYYMYIGLREGYLVLFILGNKRRIVIFGRVGMTEIFLIY